MNSYENSSLSNILTQEEIDALLEPQEENKLQPQDLLKKAQPVKQYPKLEACMDAFARTLMTSLRQITQSENIKVDIQSFIVGQFGAYLDTLPSPSMLAFYQVKDWKQSILTALDFNFSYCLLDITLGGRRGTSAMPIEGRAYTMIEKSILRNIFKSFTSDFTKTFNQQFVFENMDTNPKTALIASPACEIVITRLDVVLDKRKGVMDVIFPKHLLSYLEETEERKEDFFTEDLALALSKVPLELKALLDKKQMSFREVSKWKEGDVLPLSYFEDKPIEVSCQNMPLFKGRLQVQKKAISVILEKKLTEEV